ncbi:MAG: DM13 domain-containing protein [Verrucomicrobiota bacterium]
MNSGFKFLLIVGGLALVGWLAFGFFGVQSLFVDQEVNEEVPDFIAALSAQEDLQEEGPVVVEEETPAESPTEPGASEMPEKAISPALEGTPREPAPLPVPEKQPEPQPVLLGSGSFVKGDSTYSISGKAYLSRFQGVTSLTLVDFEVTNGPDLFLYGVKTDSTENSVVKKAVSEGQFVRLGRLKGNRGNQTYELEGELDPAEYPVLSIWCQRFSRNFGVVSLQGPF